MSEGSDPSDGEAYGKEDYKDPDFSVDDYRHEVDSEDSFVQSPESNANVDTDNWQDDEYTGPIISGHRFDRKLTCIKFPGNVVNVDRAIEMLGGISSISTTVDAPNRRLELRFRPDDGYSKPACGDRHNTIGFLLRVRVKKSRITRYAENAAVKTSKTKSTDTTNTKVVTSSFNLSEENMSCSSQNEQIESIPDIVIDKDNHKDNTSTSNLINQAQDHGVIEEDGAVTTHDTDKSLHDTCADKNLQDTCADRNLQDTCADKNSLKKNKDTLPTFDSDKHEDLSQEIDYDLPRLRVLGRIETEFKFTNLCDFQYVPITQSRSNPRELECIYKLIYPTGIPFYSWLRNKVPFFLPPAAFSRMDTVQQYIPKTETDSNPENVIGKTKKCQVGFPNYIYFTTPEVPTAAPKGIETAMKVKLLQKVHLEQVCKLFEERPIWSKNAIMYKTQFTSEQLKILLPSVAYYFMTGPWRIMWVKLGYDPRKDINARKYQTLDYRLKAMHGLGSTVRCKRNYSNYTLPYKSTPTSKQKPVVLTTTLNPEQKPKKERHLHENVYIYREGMVPPSRQMFYQYCDVLVGEIQEMLEKLPDALPGIRCHEKRGWLPTDFDVQCREILNKQVRAVLRKRMNIPEDHPTSLPRKRKHGIKLKYNKTTNKKARKRKASSTNVQSDVTSAPELTTMECD